MIGKAKTAIAVGILVCVIPVITLGQTFNSMPTSKFNDNNRFFNDVFGDSSVYYSGVHHTKHPSLTLNGFDNGGNNTYGYGLKQILQLAYQGDPMVDTTFNNIINLSREPYHDPLIYNNTNGRLGAVWRNSNIAQCRAFVALERYIAYKNGVTNQIPGTTTTPWNSNQAIDSLKSIITLPFGYLLVDGNDFVGQKADQVKFTRSLENMARALDLYLALEDAFKYYTEPDYSDSTGGRLLTKAQKDTLESNIKYEMDILHTYEYDKIFAFFSKSNLKLEAGNRPLKIFASMGYAALTMQSYDANGPYSQVATDCETYLDEAFRSAGKQAASERLDYWSYQTDNGAHFWAEGPYYLDYALLDVVPFWHAIRINGLLDYNNYNISDPFQSGWFMNPLDWLADLSTEYGELPPIDDGNKYPIQAAAMLRWSGGSYGGYDWEPTASKFAWIDDQLKANKMPEDDNLYLIELAIPRISTGSGEAPPNYVGDQSPGSKTEQQLVMRKTIGGKTHYLLLNGENGDADVRGEGHEEANQLQLLYYVDGTSYLMGTGYNSANEEGNSSWNRYDDQNVMTMVYDTTQYKKVSNHVFETYQDDGGLESPYVDLSAEHKVSHHNQVDTLYYQNIGNITHMHGSVQLNTIGHAQEAQYNRDVLFIDAPQPYLVDLNTVHTTNTGWLKYAMHYYGNGQTYNSTSNPLLVNPGWNDWTNPIKYVGNLTLYNYIGSVEFNASQIPGYSSEEEYNNSTKPIVGLQLSNEGLNQGFTTVGFFEVNGQTPSYVPKPVFTYSGHTTPYQAWSWHQDANTLDVVIKRSFLDNLNTNINFTLYDNGSHVAALKLPAGDDYGFIRFEKSNGIWTVDTNYQINLTRTDYDYSSNTTISTKTYPTSADIWIGNNVTLTVTGTMSLPPGTIVHMGIGSVIQTTGSGNIQATSTVFKTLTGSNDASQRWLHIILEGNGGSTFTQCTFNGASQAIYVDSQGNTVDRCTFQYNSCGLYAWTGSVYIDGSTFSNNPDYGIYEGGTGYAQLYGYQSGSTFIPNTISDNYYGVNIYDNAWVVLKNAQVDNNTYGAINYGSTMLQTGNHNDSGGCPAYVGYGWNRFRLNSSYAIYNGSSQTDYANDNWWGSVSGPSTSNLYGNVNYADYLNYDPTINGGPQTGSCGSGGGCPPTCTIAQAVATKVHAMNAGTQGTDSSSTQSPVVSFTSTSTQGGVSERLTSIYGQLAKNPGASDNYRLLQEAYQLVQMDDPADTTSLLRELDSYTGQFNTAINQASSVISTGTKPTASNNTISPTLSQTTLRMGSTAVLLKMDYLLHKEKWGSAQNLADQFAPYFQHSNNESSFLASRAVAWEHQKQFAEALAAYQQIDNLQPKSPPAGYVAPDYSFIEAELKDSVKVYGQSPVASQEAGQSESAMKGNQELPKKFSVGDSYPNPFNPTTIIPISLPKAAHVRVVVYNVVGQQVATLANRAFQAGTYQLRFNADQLASGVYFIRARLGEKLFTTRVTLIK